MPEKKKEPVVSHDYEQWSKGVDLLTKYIADYRKHDELHRKAVQHMSKAVIKVDARTQQITRTLRIDRSCAGDVVKAAYGLTLTFAKYANEMRRVIAHAMAAMEIFYRSSPDVTVEEREKIKKDIGALRRSMAGVKRRMVATVKRELMVFDNLTKNYAPDLYEVFRKKDLAGQEK
jgi:hypothetical protein